MGRLRYSHPFAWTSATSTEGLSFSGSANEAIQLTVPDHCVGIAVCTPDAATEADEAVVIRHTNSGAGGIHGGEETGVNVVMFPYESGDVFVIHTNAVAYTAYVTYFVADWSGV